MRNNPFYYPNREYLLVSKQLAHLEYYQVELFNCKAPLQVVEKQYRNLRVIERRKISNENLLKFLLIEQRWSVGAAWMNEETMILEESKAMPTNYHQPIVPMLHKAFDR